MPTSRAGRPRDDSIDDAVLAATLRALAEPGYEAMSLAGIADAAGTTRQAIYRRWASKAEVAVAAIESLPDASALTPTGDHEADLTAELAAFTRGVLRAGGISMVGTMLGDGTDPELRQAYRARIVAPRRARLRAILDAAVDDGRLPRDTDVDLAVASCTGTLYALALAGEPIPNDYPRRMTRRIFSDGCPTGAA